ncbi:hypothetical protein [Cohaesibacter sp. ES.047]|uniref:hypothetical protein n=1 Tax=Cohaesibacter sp. ES.047 TaxID=1798205 RepID=UPI0012FD0148|nr:hypothetical protein [Cohaesibacter sp. ES.047]
MYDLSRFPEFVLEGKPLSQPIGSFGEALGIGATGGVAAIGRMMSVQTEITNHTAASLIQFLHFRTTTTRQAYNRSSRWWGRWYNKMSGQHPIYVPLSGHHLIQILNTAGQTDIISQIPQKARCGMRLDIAENYLSELQKIYLSRK